MSFMPLNEEFFSKRLFYFHSFEAAEVWFFLGLISAQLFDSYLDDAFELGNQYVPQSKLWSSSNVTN